MLSGLLLCAPSISLLLLAWLRWRGRRRRRACLTLAPTPTPPHNPPNGISFPTLPQAPSKAVVPRSPNSFFRSFLGVAVAAVAVVAVAALGGALPKRDAKAAAPKK